MITEVAAETIADWAIDCLKLGQGSSCIRLGDGEGRLLMWPKFIARDMLDRHLRYWFGHASFEDRDVTIMRSLLLRAIELSDVVCYKKGQTAPFWRYPETWMAQNCRRDVWTNDNDLHQYLWNKHLLDEIVLASERVVLVTCRDVVKPFRQRYGKETAWVCVPEEGHTGKRPTDHFRHAGEIMCEAARQCEAGVLALVGAGCLGKWYAAMCGKVGAVGLDIGSLFDLWNGIPSRSWVSRDLTLTPTRGKLVAEDEADQRAM